MLIRGNVRLREQRSTEVTEIITPHGIKEECFK